MTLHVDCNSSEGKNEYEVEIVSEVAQKSCEWEEKGIDPSSKHLKRKTCFHHLRQIIEKRIAVRE